MTLSVNGSPAPWPAGVDAPAPVDPQVEALAGQLRELVSSQLQAYTGETVLTAGERERLVERLLRDALDSYAQAAIAAGMQPLDATAEATVSRRVRDALLGLGGLDPLVRDKSIENIDINGYDNVWVQYVDGRRAQVAAVAASDRELEELIRQIVAHAGQDERRFDRGSPTVSAQLEDGSRLFAVMAVAHRPSVSIRRHRLMRITLDDLACVYGECSQAMAALFTAMVRAKLNIVVAGGTNTGKTTFLRALAAAIPPYERLLTVEDAYELALHRDPQHPNMVALQSREANIEGAGAKTLTDLMRDALRMNPDRVIVGEVRGPEAREMCKAMSQGNDGSLCTVHASSSVQAFTRLATYVAEAYDSVGFDAIAQLIAGAVNVVVHLDWTRDGHRVVSSIREVTGFDGRQVVSNEVYRPGPDGRGRPAVPLRPQTLTRLVEVGFDPSLLDADLNGWG